jgi:serine/threonine protein kinase
MADLTGRTLNRRYRVEELIGRGGMAEVYRAYDTRRNYPVAIKVLREDLAEDWEFIQRFRAEAENLAHLAHQNIVRFYSLEQDQRIAFIVMDYIDGDTLRGRLFDMRGPLSPAKALAILRQLAAALHYAHSEGILHRDVKAGNIMLRSDGTALLSDFGIAKAADAATATTVMPGTPAYMSPEQCQGGLLDARTDVYSLGVVLYEMLAGRRPFAGTQAPDTVTGGTRERIRWEQIYALPPSPRTYNPALTESMARVMLKALAKNPGDRYPSALALLQDFEQACAPPKPAPSPPRRPSRFLPRPSPYRPYLNPYHRRCPPQPGPSPPRLQQRVRLPLRSGLLALPRRRSVR